LKWPEVVSYFYGTKIESIKVAPWPAEPWRWIVWCLGKSFPTVTSKIYPQVTYLPWISRGVQGLFY